MSKRHERRQTWITAAARWLPFLFTSFFAAGMHAQTSGIAPLISGDCSVTTIGALVCSKTNGTSFAASATTDTTNAANITNGTLAVSRTAALSGDVTKAAGSATTTVTAINGLALPNTSGIAATNTAGQIVAATSTQLRALACSGTPSANYYCDGSTGAWVAVPWTGSGNANITLYNTNASTASTPAMLFTGAVYSGGTGTTTTPHWYINNGATAPTAWSTGGTDMGMNAANGFAGNFLDFHTNGGPSLFRVTFQGQVYANAELSGNSYTATKVTGGFIAPLYTPASSTATCTTGTMAWDASYVYVCKATNSWMRSAMSAF